MKKMVDDRANVDANNSSQVPKQKERRIVSWSQEEDDILREQIRVHGTENWAIIASKFKDKTTRQCRRRWFTYLNSDFKKGGWSPEEDMLLCEAQKIYGNRWTEIAKVVPGRTDNAVKNRFSTLCRKMAKREALTKGNSATSYVKLNNKRVVSRTGFNADGNPKSDEPIKRTRTCITETVEHCEPVKLAGDCGGVGNHLCRLPLSVAPQSVHICEVNNISTEVQTVASNDGSINTKTEGSFLNEDDPKVLSSLARKVNKEMTNQSPQDVLIVLEDHLKQNKGGNLLTMSSNADTGFQLENFKELRKNLKRDNEGSRSSVREPDAYESSPTTSECSTGSTQLSDSPDKKSEEYEAEISMVHQEIGPESQLDQLDHQCCLADENGIGFDAGVKEVENINSSDDMKGDDGAAQEYSYTEFSSPLHVTPLFRVLAAAIPSPQFSESERHFLMKTLGMESPSPSSLTNPSQPPPCKRSLLRSL